MFALVGFIMLVNGYTKQESISMKRLKQSTVGVLVLSLLGHLLLWGYTSRWTFGSGSGYTVFALLPPLLLLYIVTLNTEQDTMAKQVGSFVTSLVIGLLPIYAF